VGTLRRSVKVIVPIGAVAAAFLLTLLFVVRPDEGRPDEGRPSIETQLKERFLIETRTCQETSSGIFYRCEFKTAFRSVPGPAIAGEWCVMPDGTPGFPIRARSESRRCT
jgi:hypothetical protein